MGRLKWNYAKNAAKKRFTQRANAIIVIRATTCENITSGKVGKIGHGKIKKPLARYAKQTAAKMKLRLTVCATDADPPSAVLRQKGRRVF